MLKNTKALLIDYCKRYPKLQIQDIFKFLYQSSFGCEHLVSSLDSVKEYIFNEYTASDFYNEDEIEQLDGDYVRLPLTYIDKGLSINTFSKLFVASSKKEINGLESLQQKLDLTEELILNNLIPFSKEDFIKAKAEWQIKGYPAIHHSETYRKNYNPSYRVISKEFVKFLPLFITIDTMLKCSNVKIAIDGGSASGKTTLSQVLQNIYDCTVLHMDDFFLQPHQRTQERFQQIGGNIDWERFLKEVVTPLNNGVDVTYKKFDCSTMSFGEEIKVTKKQLTVIEGAYSMHPEFKKYYDYSVFLSVDKQTQKERILKRNTKEFAKRFFNEWIPLENIYFDKTDIKKRADLVIDIS